MLVAFDATTIRGNKTGVGYYTARLLERLTRVGGRANPIDELVVLSNRSVPVPDGLPRTTVYRGGQLPIRAVWMQGVLPFVLKRLTPDVTHFTNFLAPVLPSGRYVVTFHDMSLQLMPHFHTLRKRLLTATLMPEVARGARFVITPSESARRDVARVMGVPMSKIRAIPHAPDPIFQPDRRREERDRIRWRYGLDRPYVLYVGTLEPRKNIAGALAAFARLARRFPDHVFCLVGGLGWKYHRTLEAIHCLGLTGRVRRLGYVEENDLPSIYAHAELLAYASHYEGFGFPVVEGMASGVPVMTSNTSALREVADGAALLVDPNDVSAMTEAMERGLVHGRDRDAIIARGLARARSFSWERTVGDTISVYEEAAERSQVRSPRHPAVDRARAVARTVAYGALFDFPMKLDEIDRTLMGVSLGVEELRALLEHDAYVRSRVDKRGPYYTLKERGGTIPLRWNRERQTRRLLERHRRFLGFVCRTPYVRLVALSGATAHGNAADGDIDLFLLTSRGRVWAVSMMLFVAAKLTGLRRVMCMNYLMSDRRLELPERDPFTAHQIVALKPMAGGEAYARFVAANHWGRAYFPNFWERVFPLSRPIDVQRAGAPWLERVLSLLGVGWTLEWVGRAVLGSYLRWQYRRTGRPVAVRLETERIKLHFKDHGRPLNDRLAEALGESSPEGEKVVLGG